MKKSAQKLLLLQSLELMAKITSLADEIRSRIAQPPEPAAPQGPKPQATQADILAQLKAYDNADHKTLVHVRFDEQTVRTLNQLKLATGIDVTRLVAYSVRSLFDQHPELKNIIKQFMQNL
jgi:hypothetical protein